MDITSFSHESIMKGLDSARKESVTKGTGVRVLFSPKRITEQNFNEVCSIYATISEDDFDTVVIIESHPGSAEKKLPMPSFNYLDTQFGRVHANDRLRNDFADEDDDFFINDDAFDENLSLQHQLLMLQSVLNDFSVLSIQITDENSFIIKELAFAIEEILASKNALVVCCCDMEQGKIDELRKVVDSVVSGNMSAVLNYLNSDISKVDGVGTFITGLMVAKKWDLSIEFPAITDVKRKMISPIYGYAALQRQSILN